MRAFFIIYDVENEDDIMSALESANIEAYTKWDRVLGKGKNSDPKMDDPVWPGFNNMIFIVTDGEKGNKLIEVLSLLSKRLSGKGLKVFEFSILEVF